MILFGVLFSGFVRFPRRGSVFADKYFWHGIVFSTLFNGAVLYAIVKAPDWMWMYYLADSQNTIPELIYIFIFLYYLPYALGFYLGVEFKQQSWLLWGMSLVFFAAAEGWLIFKLFDRYSVVGTNEEFANHTAISLFSPENPLGTVLNGSVVLMVVYFLFVIVLHRRSRKKFI